MAIPRRFQYQGISELRKAAVLRLGDADELRRCRRWSGAVYLRGYVLEIRLKVVLMERHGVLTLRALERVLAAQSRTGKVAVAIHEIDSLFVMAGLGGKRLTQEQREAYNRCKEWGPQLRYSSGEGSIERCGEFFKAADVIERFIAANL